MKVIHLKRGEGKTDQLIKMVDKSGIYIVCSSMDRCNEVYVRAMELDCNIKFPISFDEFLDKSYYPMGIEGFVIDDADSLLQRLTRVEICAISLTEELPNKVRVVNIRGKSNIAD